MPKPGPRQFDCVRRGWHSDNHQPIRGTLIQEIFRVVDEIHGSATKKNKEYLEKLPIVVLKAEEILYSKANSEAEYMDLTTLLGRANDAIDTIIRRDEHTETGQYLQPCIEAALSLGCSLSKTSRSQRNSTRCYLSHSTEDEAPPNVNYDTAQNANTRDNSTKKSQHDVSTKNVPPATTSSGSKKQCLQPSNLFSVYPLYYGNNTINQLEESQHGFTVSIKSTSNTFGPAIRGVEKCDLSLRLGPLTVPAPSIENGEVQKNMKVEPYG